MATQQNTDGSSITTTVSIALVDVGPQEESTAMVELCDRQVIPAPACPDGATCTGEIPAVACVVRSVDTFDADGLAMVECARVTDTRDTDGAIRYSAGVRWRSVRVAP